MKNNLNRFPLILLCCLFLTFSFYSLTGCSKASEESDSPKVSSGQVSENSSEAGSSANSASVSEEMAAASTAPGDSAGTTSAVAEAANPAAAAATVSAGSATAKATTALAVSTNSTASAALAEPAAAGTSEAAQAASTQAASTSKEEKTEKAEPRKLKYIDAWQEWHTMEVDPSVAENSYDNSLFVHPEENPDQITYDGDFECLQGIDVSEYQGEIDWQTVADAGYRFAFIRVGYRGYGEAGTLVEDTMAVKNLQKAKEAGLYVGTYFFSQALNEKEAAEEAALSLKVIEESGVETDLPLMYDPEIIRDDDGRADEITREQVALNTAAFREAVESASSCKVDIYASLPWEHRYFDGDTLNTYEIWYADYEPLPQTPYHFTWWQYSEKGSVPGIEGDVDLDLWIR